MAEPGNQNTVVAAGEVEKDNSNLAAGACSSSELVVTDSQDGNTSDNTNTRKRKHPQSEPTDPFEGWTKDEQLLFLQSVKLYGSKNFDCIQNAVPTVSDTKLQKAIEYFRKQASLHPTFTCKIPPYSRKITSTYTPLAKWAKYLTEHADVGELNTAVPTALRLIADTENRPDVGLTDSFDFAKAYHCIADAMEGKTVPNNPRINSLLNKCVIEAILNSKPFMKTSAFKQIINRVDMHLKDSIIMPPRTDNSELAVIQLLTQQQNYNPLNIPIKFMTFSTHTEIS